MRIGLRNRKIVIAGGVATALLIVTALVLLIVSNRIIKDQIEKSLGGSSTVERIALGWNRVEVIGLRLFPNSSTTISVARLDIRASFLTVFGRRYELSHLTIHRPSVRLHFDRKGDLDNHFRRIKRDRAEPLHQKEYPRSISGK